MKIQSVKKFLTLAFAALSSLSLWAAHGLNQVIYSSANYEGTDASKIVSGSEAVVPGAILACVTPGSSQTGSWVVGDKSYCLGANQTAAYTGYMKMVGGVTYRFVKSYDDSGFIRIDGSSSWLLKNTSYSSVVYASYTPASTGMYAIELRVGNGTGGVGPQGSPFTSIPAGLLWSTNETSVTAANVANWHRFLNTDDETLFFTTPARLINAFSVTQGTGGALKATLELGAGTVTTPLYLVSDETDRGETFDAWAKAVKVADVPAAAQTVTCEFAGPGTTDGAYRFVVRDETADAFTAVTRVSSVPNVSLAIDDDGPGTTATVTATVANCGRGETAADLYFAWGNVADGLGAYEKIGENLKTGAAVSKKLTELVRANTYAYSLVASNATCGAEVAAGTFTHGYWTYDSAAGTITDDDWVFNVSLSSSGTISVNSIKTAGSSTEIYFNMPVVGANGAVITTLGTGLFYNANGKKVTHVSLPSTLTTIGQNAFREMTNLETIEPFLPDTVTSIGTECFRDSTKLTGDLTLGNDDARAYAISGSYNFYQTAVTSLTMKPGCTSLPDNCFMNCYSLTNAVLPEGLLTLGTKVFGWDSYLASVSLPSTIETIGTECFNYCVRLRSVTPFLPQSVKEIKYAAFANCYRLVADTLEIGFGTDEGGDPISVAVGSSAFSGGLQISHVEIGPGVTALPDSFCASDPVIEAVTLHDGITSYGAKVFYGCSGLTTISPAICPAAIVSIGNEAFSGCSSLTGEVVLGTEHACTLGGNYTFNGTKVTRVVIGDYVTCKIPDYMFVSDSALVEATIGSGVTEIGTKAFNQNSSLKRVTLPEGLLKIGTEAFAGDSALETVTPLLPTGMTSVAYGAFNGCSKLEGAPELAVDGHEISLGSYVFANCSKITGITFGEAIRQIPEQCCNECGQLATVTLPSQVTNLQAKAFNHCYALAEIKPKMLPDTVAYVGNECFTGCSKLTGELSVGLAAENVKLVNSSTFNGCSGLTALTFGEGLVQVGNNAFQGDSKIAKVTFRDYPATIGSNAFQNWGKYQSRFIVPKDDADWNAYIDDSAKAEAPTEAELAQYAAAYPGEPAPRALTKTIFPAKQWIVSYGMAEEGEKNVTVSGLPGEFGTVDPAYGAYTNVTSLTLTAPRYASVGTTLYESSHYVIETPDVAGWANPQTNAVAGAAEREVSTVVYAPAEDGSYRFSWLWTPAAYQVEMVTPADPSLATITYSKTDLQGYYTPGSTMTVTITPAAGVTFVRWHGDVPAGHETDTTLTVTMDGAKKLTPELVAPWTYDQSKQTLTDGNWILSTSGNRAAIVITAVKTSSSLGLLDLTKPIVDGGAFTAFQYDAFKNNAYVTELRLPETLVTIDRSAFNNCSSLTNVVPLLPSSVKTIGQYAFYGTKVAGDLVLGNGEDDVSIGQYAFQSTRISSIYYSEGITKSGNETFREATKLGDVHLPSTLTKVDNKSFYGCTALTNVAPFLPPTVTSVGEYAFYNCSKLTNAVSVGFGGVPVSLSSRAFYHFGTSAMEIGPGVTSIPTYLAEASSMKSLVLADTIGSIGEGAFKSCTGLKTVKLPSKVGIVGSSAFYNCSSLTSIEPFLPSTLTNIGASAFRSTPVRNDLVLDNRKYWPITFGTYAFEYSKPSKVTLGRGIGDLPEGVFKNMTAVKELYFRVYPTKFGSNCLGGWSTRQAIVYLPRGNAEWLAFYTDTTKVTPWETLSADTKELYYDRCPGEKPPYGLSTSSAPFGVQWIRLWTPSAPPLCIIVR